MTKDADQLGPPDRRIPDKKKPDGRTPDGRMLDERTLVRGILDESKIVYTALD